MALVFQTREQYLTEAAALILDDLIMPAVESSPFDYPRPNFRISVGFPKHSRGGKAIAVCFNVEASSDGVNEIFINPEIDEPIRVMDCIAHELIHAVDNLKSGHRNFFARIARKIGLEGPFTATHAGDQLRRSLEEYSALLGDFPHHKMNIDKGHKKAATRMIKVECSDCGFHFRTSQAQINRMSHVAECPACRETYTLQAV